MTTLPKGTDIGTSNLQPGELIQMKFSFYNVTSVHGFTPILNVLCEKNRMI